MIDKTLREIRQAFATPPGNTRSTSDARIEVLVAVVLDLLMEVEALRKVVSATKLGIGGRDSAYGRAYEETAYLTHNASGPSSGLEKLLALFYPQVAEVDGRTGREQGTWRECLLLRRLGFSDEEVQAYKKAAGEAEIFT